jgi:hypothetical protein
MCLKLHRSHKVGAIISSWYVCLVANMVSSATRGRGVGDSRFLGNTAEEGGAEDGVATEDEGIIMVCMFSG